MTKNSIFLKINNKIVLFYIFFKYVTLFEPNLILMLKVNTYKIKKDKKLIIIIWLFIKWIEDAGSMGIVDNTVVRNICDISEEHNLFKTQNISATMVVRSLYIFIKRDSFFPHSSETIFLKTFHCFKDIIIFRHLKIIFDKIKNLLVFVLVPNSVSVKGHQCPSLEY